MLLSPLKYLKIQHPVKRRWDFVSPVISGTLFTLLIYIWPEVDSPFGKSGYIVSLQSLYATLGGFYITCLTVITSIGSSNLDEPMDGYPAVTIGNDKDPMTRRRFLGFLFGYMAFLCFCMYIFGLCFPIFAPGVVKIFSISVIYIASNVVLLIYNIVLSHLFFTTLLGLYYFSDRLQRPKSEIFRDESRK